MLRRGWMAGFLRRSVVVAVLVLSACTSGPAGDPAASTGPVPSDDSPPAGQGALGRQSQEIAQPRPYRLRVRRALVVTAHAVYDDRGRHPLPFEVVASTWTDRGAVVVDPRGGVWNWQARGLHRIG